MALMTIHEALCTIKVADKKIRKILQDAKFIGVKKFQDAKLGGKPIGDFEKSAVSKYDEFMSVIGRVQAIKAALNLSNAKTMITVCGKQMTIAEAIYQINTGIPEKELVLEKMAADYKAAVAEAEHHNGPELDEKTERYITSNFGQKDKADAKVLKEAEEDYRKRNTYELVDPINLEAKIGALQKEIDSFKTSVDSAIQVSNATTVIEIPDNF